MNKYLSINRCPEHLTYSISIDDDGGGTRVTPDKCCGRWHIVKQWPVDAKNLTDIIVELECAIEAMG